MKLLVLTLCFAFAISQPDSEARDVSSFCQQIYEDVVASKDPNIAEYKAATFEELLDCITSLLDNYDSYLCEAKCRCLAGHLVSAPLFKAFGKLHLFCCESIEKVAESGKLETFKNGLHLPVLLYVSCGGKLRQETINEFVKADAAKAIKQYDAPTNPCQCDHFYIEIEEDVKKAKKHLYNAANHIRNYCEFISCLHDACVRGGKIMDRIMRALLVAGDYIRLYIFSELGRIITSK